MDWLLLKSSKKQYREILCCWKKPHYSEIAFRLLETSSEEKWWITKPIIIIICCSHHVLWPGFDVFKFRLILWIKTKDIKHRIHRTIRWFAAPLLGGFCPKLIYKCPPVLCSTSCELKHLKNLYRIRRLKNSHIGLWTSWNV